MMDAFVSLRTWLAWLNWQKTVQGAESSANWHRSRGLIGCGIGTAVSGHWNRNETKPVDSSNSSETSPFCNRTWGR